MGGRSIYSHASLPTNHPLNTSMRTSASEAHGNLPYQMSIRRHHANKASSDLHASKRQAHVFPCCTIVLISRIPLLWVTKGFHPTNEVIQAWCPLSGLGRCRLGGDWHVAGLGGEEGALEARQVGAIGARKAKVDERYGLLPCRVALRARHRHLRTKKSVLSNRAATLHGKASTNSLCFRQLVGL